MSHTLEEVIGPCDLVQRSLLFIDVGLEQGPISYIYRSCPPRASSGQSNVFIEKCAAPLHFFYNFIIVEDMRKREYLGQLELMVLLAVIRPAKDAYGVLISREIAEKSGREVALASVYAALERLEKKGLVISALGEPTAERGGRARTYFKASAAGLSEARDAHETLLRLSSGLSSLKGETV
jgi:PadR family transcriptional regulator PadR